MKMVGINELQMKLEKNMRMDAVRDVVKKNGSELQAKAQRNAPVDTGTLKRSIGLEICDNGLTVESEATADYAAYQEYGTRFMKAQPYMRPAFNVQKEQFKRDLSKMVR